LLLNLPRWTLVTTLSFLFFLLTGTAGLTDFSVMGGGSSRVASIHAIPEMKPSVLPLAHSEPVQPTQPPYVWPVTGPITSWFEPDHPLGIDIGLSQTPDAPIQASAAGIVSFAGGRACCSYGLYVMVDHGDELTTVYAHLSRIDVVEGQQVEQGSVLGLAGETGASTSEHLHMEFRITGTKSRLDPMLFLPQACNLTVGTLQRDYAMAPGSQCAP
jgi:murein DD-endopeptidase MepM/ murein hydrolase activator NlpD